MEKDSNFVIISFCFTNCVMDMIYHEHALFLSTDPHVSLQMPLSHTEELKNRVQFIGGERRTASYRVVS